MVYRFTVISNEKEDFIREIKIDADATFHDLHRTILGACGYTDDQPTSFSICNDAWEPEEEILLEDMGTGAPDEDLYLMRETRLSEMLEDEKQRLTYMFDPVGERMFLIELTEISFGTPQEEPVCSRRHGKAPMQTSDFGDIPVQETKRPTVDLNEDFYGSDDFDEEEFDPEGFEISESNPYA